MSCSLRASRLDRLMCASEVILPPATGGRRELPQGRSEIPPRVRSHLAPTRRWIAGARPQMLERSQKLGMVPQAE
jgi:hypothetical protein